MVASLSVEGGNTSTPSPQDIQSRKWCFTFNNYTEDEYITLIASLKSKKWDYIIGREVGESGNKHLQGYIKCKSCIRFSTLKNIQSKLHIEKAKGTDKQNITYCSKEGDFASTFKPDPEHFRKELIQKILASYAGVKWKPFQQEILTLIDKEPDSRSIHWYYEEEGNTGKSFLAKYIVCKYDGVILCDGKKDNIFNQVNNVILNCIEPRIIILDIPRSHMAYINYDAIEQLKNGLLYSGKYEGGICVFPCPHVVAFANQLPDESSLSKDRWNIVEIK